MSEPIFSNIEPLGDQEPTVEGNNPLSEGTSEVVQQPKPIVSNKYTNITPLAESRYGKSRVFKAKSGTGTVVIKALKEEFCGDPKSEALLKSEYEITNALDNRYIRKAIAYEKIEGLGNCVVFEYVQGKTLWEHVRLGTVNEKQVKNILLEICDGLSYMHKNGVVHCDLRPENILITSDYHIKLIDIGSPETEYEANKEILVKELEFIAPELIKGEDGDVRSDIYSVGKIMEFIHSRNMMKEYIEVATPCTQYSKEQRYESVSDLKSALSSGGSPTKLIVILVLLLVAAAVIYGIGRFFGSKLADNEDAQREQAFSAVIAEIKDKTPSLCEKYSLKGLNDPLRPAWAEDSVSFAQKMNALNLNPEMKKRGLDALAEMGNAIYQNRKKDFDKILLHEYENAGDSVAMKLKGAIPNPTPEQMSQNAHIWFEDFAKNNQ